MYKFNELERNLMIDLNDVQQQYEILGGYNYQGDTEKILVGLGFQRSDFNKLTDTFSGGWRMRIELAKLLLQQNDILLLDEPFAALDILTIKMLQEIIVNLQSENKITICICDHQARDLLACVDVAMILSNGKIIAQDTPSNIVNNINAKNAYFGDNFKFN